MNPLPHGLALLLAVACQQRAQLLTLFIFFQWIHFQEYFIINLKIVPKAKPIALHQHHVSLCRYFADSNPAPPWSTLQFVLCVFLGQAPREKPHVAAAAGLTEWLRAKSAAADAVGSASKPQPPAFATGDPITYSGWHIA